MKRRRDPDVLRVRWSKAEDDLLISYPRSCDGHLAYGALCGDRMRLAVGEKPPWDFDPSFVEELKRRGYDIRTLKFSVRRIVPRVYPEGLSAQAGKGE